MLINPRFRNTCTVAGALAAAAAVLVGCAVNLPPPPVSNPADAHAPETAIKPLRPTLLATSHTFLSPAAGDREQAAKQMDISKMKHGTSDKGTERDEMPGMSEMSKGAPALSENYYTCPMHAQIKEGKPGNCPICGMTLVKKSTAPEGAKP
jgi:Heavy metal binding domain